MSSGKFPLNLSHFKKLSSDKDSTILQHKDGHELKIAHAGISPKMRSQLAELGGVDKPVKMADGGDPKAMQIEQVPDSEMPAEEDAPPKQLQAEPASDAEIGQLMGGDQAAQPAQELDLKNMPQFASNDIGGGSAADRGIASQAPAEATKNSDDLYGAGIEQAKLAEDIKANAMSDISKAQSQAYKQSIDQQVKLIDNSKLALDHINSTINDITEDYKQNHISPNHYLENMGAGQKVATAIGLILGGIGGGLTHQENPALKFLNAQIDRDLAAQQANMGKQHNLLSALQQQYGNTMVANNMFRLARADILKSQIDQAAANSGSQMAISNALAAKAGIDLHYGPLKKMMSEFMGQQASGMGGQPQDQDAAMRHRLQMLRIFNPGVAKDLEARYVPGVGEGSVPVSEDARKQLIAGKNFIEAAQDLRNWSQKHAGTVMDRAVVNEGKTKAMILQNAYRTASQMGVYKQSEAPLLDQVIPSDPTAFLNKLRIDPKIKAVEQEVMRNTNNVRQAHGLPQMSAEQAFSPEQQQLINLARQHPENPKAQMFLKSLGLEK